MGCAGGTRHELLGYQSESLFLAWLQDCASFQHLAAAFMREVAPPFSFRGADDLQPIFMTCMSRGNEARIWSGHHLQNDLCLARLRSAPRPCTLTSSRRWAYVPELLGASSL